MRSARAIPIAISIRNAVLQVSRTVSVVPCIRRHCAMVHGHAGNDRQHDHQDWAHPLAEFNDCDVSSHDNRTPSARRSSCLSDDGAIISHVGPDTLSALSAPHLLWLSPYGMAALGFSYRGSQWQKWGRKSTSSNDVGGRLTAFDDPGVKQILVGWRVWGRHSRPKTSASHQVYAIAVRSEAP